MAKQDFYEILGVSRTASTDEIKTAFRQMARKYHPDVNKEADAEERFKELNEAFVVLSDPDKRAVFDRYGHAGLNGMGGGGGAQDFSTVDFSDLFEGFFGGFGGGRRAESRNSPRRGADLSQVVTLTFEEAVFGVEKEVEITRNEVCSRCHGKRAEPGTSTSRCMHCDGRGEVRQMHQTILGSMVQVATCPVCKGQGEVVTNPCTTCRGSGLERKVVRKNVSIPAGVDTGTQIRLSGEGQPGTFGGPKGNLYLEIQVRAHKFFHRRQDDIFLNMNINVAQATLGAEIEIPTLDGPTKLSIPNGTQPGKVFTMKGKGVPHLRGGGRGDQQIVVNVEVPARLTGDQRKLFEQLAETLGSDVNPQERSFFDKLKEVLGG